MAPAEIVDKLGVLRGIYFTNTLSDLIRQRRPLLTISSGITFHKSTMEQFSIEQEFESDAQHITFHTALKTSGIRMAQDAMLSDVSRSKEEGINECGISGRQEAGVSGRQEEGISARQEAGVSGRQEAGVSGRQEESVSGRQEEGVSGRQEEGVSGRQEEGVSGRQEEGVSGRQEEGISARQEAGVNGRQEEDVNESGVSGRQAEGEQHTPGRYCSKIKCTVVPTAAWKPNISEMFLCEDAKEHLIEIEKLLNSKELDDAKNKCQSFFNQFGSHFYKGDINFGGIYFTNIINKSAEVNQFVLEGAGVKLNDSVNHETRRVEGIRGVCDDINREPYITGGPPNDNNIESYITGGQPNDNNIKPYITGGQPNDNNIKPYITGGQPNDNNIEPYITGGQPNDNNIEPYITGGQPNDNNMDTWKQELRTNNSTWVVIDKGGMNIRDYIGVWDLVRSQPSIVSDANSLSKFIYKTWQLVSGLNSGCEALSVMLNKLGLSEKYPGKISISEVLTIHDDIFSQAQNTTDIPWAILRKIISIDYCFRESVLEEQNLIAAKIMAPEEKLLSDKEASIVKMLGKSKLRRVTLHPSDVLLTIFYCCDPFVKKLIVQKMSVCQLAVPLLYKDYTRNMFIFSLFPIREIFIETEGFLPKSVASHPLHVVSFVRLGSENIRSKSKLINEFLRDQNAEHSTFLHRDCQFGVNERTLATGTIEATWYVPRVETNNDEPTDTQTDIRTKIKQPLTILNLRGDLFKHETQAKFLLQSSSIIVLLITYENLSNPEYATFLVNVHKSKASVIIFTDRLDGDELFLDKYVDEKTVKFTKTRFMFEHQIADQRKLNAVEVKHQLTEHIVDLMGNVCDAKSLEELTKSFPPGILTDEKDDCCTNGRQMSQDVLSDIISKTSQNVKKDELLPLQGQDLWCKWSQLQKENCRSGRLERYDMKERLPNAMKDIRRKQVEMFNKVPGVIDKFIKTLVTNIFDEELCSYFLFWINHTLNCQSMLILPALRQKFHDAFNTYEHSRSKEATQSLYQAERNLSDASLGLEHLLREMGQIYEAFSYSKMKYRDKMHDQLPVVAAKLLLMGQSLEIMDGDAANVPLKWIEAVFKNIHELIGSDKRVFVISVLGVQSSGKSTLLNAMFGLKFTVSAGRCTRGMFVQLIPVDPSRSKVKCDYAMIIDTEGLRAPELAVERIHHDNELATLVIGLGDVVLINMKGETMTDMKDVLEIVVYGLLRLKQANGKLRRNQSCILIHQNVSESDSDYQTLQGKKKTLEHLDDMTKAAASQEQISGINSFRQVIKFNPLKDDKNVPDLWYGCPPMAPSSPKYSQKITEIAKGILENIAVDNNEGTVKFVTIWDVYQHLEALWKGIWAEDFVFSFRNCLEVKSYSLLDTKYQQLRWNLEETQINWWNEHVRRRLNACSSGEELDHCASELVTEFSNLITKTASDNDKLLVEFVENSIHGDRMIHWKHGKQRNLAETRDDLKREVKSKIDQETESFKVVSRTQSFIQNKQEEINDMASELASKLKGKEVTPTELDDEFNSMWIKWITEVDLPKMMQMEESANEIKTELWKVMFEKFSERHEKFPDRHALLNESRRTYKGSPYTDKIHEGFEGGIMENSFRNILTFNTKKNTFIDPSRIIKEIFDNIDEYFKFLENTDTEYNGTHFSKILNFVIERCDEQNNMKDGKSQFMVDYKLQSKFLVHVFHYSCEKFNKMNKIYLEKHSILHQLEKHKEKARNLFQITFHAKTKDIITAYCLVDEVQELITERMERDLPVEIEKHMVQKFNHNKYHLMKAILEDLAEKENFDEYILYIRGPEDYALKWITEKTKNTFWDKRGERRYSRWAEARLTSLIEAVQSAANTATARTKDVTNWIEVFRNQIESLNLMLIPDSFKITQNSEISDFNIVMKHFGEELIKFMDKELNKTKEMTTEKIKWKNKSPYERVYEYLWGCQEKCPICAEPCRKGDLKHASVDNDYHECIQHRPQGINGVSWRTTEILCVETCNFNVQSTNLLHCGRWCGCMVEDCDVWHPFRQYKKYIPTWDIAPSNDVSTYWKWVMAKFCQELTLYYKRKLDSIPVSWTAISKQEAVNSLTEYLNN